MSRSGPFYVLQNMALVSKYSRVSAVASNANRHAGGLNWFRWVLTFVTESPLAETISFEVHAKPAQPHRLIQ